MYSKYVRVMCLCSSSSGADHLFFMKILPLLRNEPILFPSLRTLFISGKWLEDEYAIQNLIVLLSPVTRHLELNFPAKCSANLMEDCLNIIVAGAPYLRLLKISTLGYTKGVYPKEYFSTHPSFAMLANLVDLEYFGFPPNWTSGSLLQVLSSLPKLWLLDMQYDPEISSYESHRLRDDSQTCVSDHRTAVKRCFPALEYFLLHPTLSTLQTLFSPWIPQLDAIHDLIVILQVEDQLEVCKTLAAELPCIKVLELEPVELSEAEVGVINQECLGVWESFHGLTCLDVWGIEFKSDLDTATLFPSWPNLKRLTLLAVPGSTILEDCMQIGVEKLSTARLRGLPLESLGHAAANMKQLEVLELTLVASRMKSLLEPLQKFQCLETLKLDDSFLNFQAAGFDLQHAARYISSLFDVAIPSTDDLDIVTLPEDSTLPQTVAHFLSLTERKSDTGNWAALQGYNEDYLEFHRSLLIGVFSCLDGRAHQITQEQGLQPKKTDEDTCPFCLKLVELQEDSCCDSQSDLDGSTDCSWDSSDNSGNKPDESVVDQYIK
jgi:hypothetical protein